MAKKKSADEPQQIYDDVWYVVAHGNNRLHMLECCNCGLTHIREHKFDDGRVWEKLTQDPAATLEARKRRGIVKEMKAVLKKENETV